MSYLPILQIFSYICLSIFIVAFLVKAIRYAMMPIHLRWELYPVASEKNRTYGGSYYEELDWWHKPRQRSTGNELKYMVGEIALFKEYFKRNRTYWYFVYPFHIGIFIFVIWLAVLFFQVLITTFGISTVWANGVTNLFNILSSIFGLIGLVVGSAGTASLTIKRMTDEDLSRYTNPIDIFDLSLIFTVFVSGIFAWYSSGLTFAVLAAYLQSLITFSTITGLNAATVVHVVLLGILIAYMPFTKMMHFLAKYFTYHKVRWDDEPNLPVGKIEKKLSNVFNKRINWSAPHIRSSETWADVVEGIQPADNNQ